MVSELETCILCIIFSCPVDEKIYLKGLFRKLERANTVIVCHISFYWQCHLTGWILRTHYALFQF